MDLRDHLGDLAGAAGDAAADQGAVVARLVQERDLGVLRAGLQHPLFELALLDEPVGGLLEAVLEPGLREAPADVCGWAARSPRPVPPRAGSARSRRAVR